MDPRVRIVAAVGSLGFLVTADALRDVKGLNSATLYLVGGAMLSLVF